MHPSPLFLISGFERMHGQCIRWVDIQLVNIYIVPLIREHSYYSMEILKREHNYYCMVRHCI